MGSEFTIVTDPENTFSTKSVRLLDLIEESKDGDWGQGEPGVGLLPYHVVRGTDFDDAYSGRMGRIPTRYIDSKSAERRTLEEEDILIETAGGTQEKSTGKVVLITQRLLQSGLYPFTCASFARFIRIRHKRAKPRYVYWYLRNMYELGEMWQHQVQHTGIARFQYTKFAESQHIPLPKVAVQQAIAHILGTLDDKIELLRQMNETLEAMARALFKSWFVDFDPVRKKADGLPTGLPKEIEDFFPSEFEDSELGEIPKGWKVEEISTICLVNPESWSEKSHPDSVVYVDLSSVKNGVMLSTESYKFQSAPSRARKVLRPHDTIIGTVRPGNRSFAFIDREGLTGSTGFAVLRARVPIFAEWIYLASTSDEMIDLYEHNADGGAYPAISSGFIAGQIFSTPPEAIADHFHTVAFGLFKMVASNSELVKSLSAIRDSLLPKLISGDLELTDEMITQILEPAK